MMAITTSNSIKVNPAGTVPNRAPARCTHLRNGNTALAGEAGLLDPEIIGGFITKERWLWLICHSIVPEIEQGSRH